MTVGLDNILSTQATTSSTSTTKTNSSASSVSVDDFYSLLIKQLQYQDPLNPVENTEFTSQLAQFSSLQALTDMKKSMDTLNQLQASTNNLTALTLIGKKVVAAGNIVNYTGSSMDLNYNLGDKAKAVTIKVYDGSGSVVRTVEQDNVASGANKFTWDGKNDSGTAVSQGKYYFGVSAVDYEGASVTATSYALGEVTGVKYDNGTTYLTVGDKDVSLTDVQQIAE
jgi:flagellar basal-body rod modification protein FlgD